MRLPNFPKQYYRGDRAAVARTYAAIPAFARSRGIHFLLVGQADRYDPFLSEIIDWQKLTSGPSYGLLIRAPLAALYEIKSP
jgi:hypothetical protein